MITGKKRQGFEKQVGIFEAKVLAINPTLAELDKIYGGNSGRDEEPEYKGEKEVTLADDSTMMVDSMRIVALLQDKKTQAILTAQFYLEDRIRVNKDGNRKQYINN